MQCIDASKRKPDVSMHCCVVRKLSGGVWQAWVESFVGEDHGGTVVAASAVRA
jgi:hypothetical protein